jgi:hypothetical protein
LRLFRYVLRPAIAKDKLHFDGERVTFEMKRCFSDGTRVLRFTPEQFIRRIALLIPRPRQHEITYFGLFASNSKGRAETVRVPTHRRTPAKKPSLDDLAAVTSHLPGPTLTWAELKKRCFDIDELRCEICGSLMRVLCAITDSGAIAKILNHLGLAPDPSPNRARAPPQQCFVFARDAVD